MLGVTLVKLTDTDDCVCYINLDKVSMILTDSISDEASIYLEGDRALVVKMDPLFQILEGYIIERNEGTLEYPSII
jgi:hypothetical protein